MMGAAEGYEAVVPVVEAALFSENPAVINEKITLSVMVSEKSVYLQPEIWYGGEIYSGEIY